MSKLHPSAVSLQPLAFLLLALAGFWAAPRALAQPNANPPERLTYQGFLADGSGTALATNAPKNYDVVFRIWEAQTGGANALWTEQQTVTVDKGYFSVLLGEGSQVTSPATEPHAALSTLFTNATASDRYVEMTVKGIGAGGADVKLLPRLRLLTAPYAYLATKAISANSVDGGAVTSGIVPDARLSGNVALRNGGNTFNGTQTINGAFTAASSSGSLNYYGFGGGGGIVLLAGLRGTGNNGPQFRFEGVGPGFVDIGQNNTGDFIVEQADVPRLIVSTSGNVGIGTTTPGERLTIAGVPGYNTGLKLTGNGPETGLTIENTSSGGRKYDLIAGSSTGGGGGPGLSIYDETAAAFRLNINAAGNVGIGTTTPTVALDVVGNAKVGGKFVTVGEENLRIVRGTVAANGSTIAGSGFTAINNSVGNYTITFNAAFTGIPTVTANSSQFANVAAVSVATANSFTVNLHTPTVGNYNVPFSFIAVGPR